MTLSQKLENKADDRWLPRYHTVNREYHVELSPKAGGALSARLLDVSRDGLGILLEREVRAGETYDLEVDGKGIRVKVVYCIRDLIHAGAYRVGMQRVGSTENLVSLFAAQKCITP